MSRADGKKYSLKEEDFFVAVYYTLDSREVRNFLCFLINGIYKISYKEPAH